MIHRSVVSQRLDHAEHAWRDIDALPHPRPPPDGVTHQVDQALSVPRHQQVLAMRQAAQMRERRIDVGLAHDKDGIRSAFEEGERHLLGLKRSSATLGEADLGLLHQHRFRQRLDFLDPADILARLAHVLEADRLRAIEHLRHHVAERHRHSVQELR